MLSVKRLTFIFGQILLLGTVSNALPSAQLAENGYMVLPVIRTHFKLKDQGEFGHSLEFYPDQLEETGTASAQEATTDLKWGLGIHVVALEFGHPDETRLMIADTGSDLTALDCKHLCTDTSCGSNHAHPPLDLIKANVQLVSCEENEKLSLRACSSCLNIKNTVQPEHHSNVCVYGTRYIEGSYWNAVKVKDTVTLNKVSAPVYFGCIYEEAGEFTRQTADGIMGLSTAIDTLYHQFYAAGSTAEDGFSLCIGGASGGALVVGAYREEWNTEPSKAIKMRDTLYHYWTVSLKEIKIGDTAMSSDSSLFDQGKGTIIDSGTTYIYLPESTRLAFQTAINKVAPAFPPAVSGRAQEAPFPCSVDMIKKLPDMHFVFEGLDGQDVIYTIPADSYMQHSDTQCAYGVFFADWIQGSILGQNFMDGSNVFFDRKNRQVKIARAKCPEAEALSRHNVVSPVFVGQEKQKKESSQQSTVSQLSKASAVRMRNIQSQVGDKVQGTASEQSAARLSQAALKDFEMARITAELHENLKNDDNEMTSIMIPAFAILVVCTLTLTLGWRYGRPDGNGPAYAEPLLDGGHIRQDDVIL